MSVRRLALGFVTVASVVPLLTMAINRTYAQVADVSLSLHLEAVTSLTYGDSLQDLGDRGKAILFVGEPLIIQVRLNNTLPTPVGVKAPEGRWDRALSMSLRRDGEPVSDFGLMPAPPANRFRAPQGGSTPAQISEAVRVGLSVAGGLQLPAGQYEIAARLPMDVLAGVPARTQRRIALSHAERFEVRAVVMETDALNFYSNMATHARLAGRIEEAKQWVEQILAVLPTSFTAHTQMGDIHRREGNCAAAIEEFEQALRILRGRLSPRELLFFSVNPMDFDEAEAGVLRGVSLCEHELGRR